MIWYSSYVISALLYSLCNTEPTSVNHHVKGTLCPQHSHRDICIMTTTDDYVIVLVLSSPPSSNLICVISFITTHISYKHINFTLKVLLSIANLRNKILPLTVKHETNCYPSLPHSCSYTVWDQLRSGDGWQRLVCFWALWTLQSSRQGFTDLQANNSQTCQSSDPARPVWIGPGPAGPAKFCISAVQKLTNAFLPPTLFTNVDT